MLIKDILSKQIKIEEFKKVLKSREERKERREV